MILCASAVAYAGERTITTSEQLLDRINIEDMFHDYYLIVGNPDRSDISKFWAEDGVFVLGEKEVVGVKAIQALYDNTDGAPEGALITLMGNPRISIDGNKATAYFIYTTLPAIPGVQWQADADVNVLIGVCTINDVDLAVTDGRSGCRKELICGGFCVWLRGGNDSACGGFHVRIAGGTSLGICGKFLPDQEIHPGSVDLYTRPDRTLP